MKELDRITLDPAVMGGNRVYAVCGLRSERSSVCSQPDAPVTKSSKRTHTWRKRILLRPWPTRHGESKNERSLYRRDEHQDSN